MIPGIDYPAVCVVFFCHDGKGRMLLAKRTDKARDEHGNWDPGGGMVHQGDTAIQTIYREVEEEYCAIPKTVDFLGYRDVFRGPSHWFALDFLVEVIPEVVRIGEPEKFSDIGWFRPSELPSPLHSQFMVAMHRHRIQELL